MGNARTGLLPEVLSAPWATSQVPTPSGSQVPSAEVQPPPRFEVPSSEVQPESKAGLLALVICHLKTGSTVIIHWMRHIQRPYPGLQEPVYSSKFSNASAAAKLSRELNLISPEGNPHQVLKCPTHQVLPGSVMPPPPRNRVGYGPHCEWWAQLKDSARLPSHDLRPPPLPSQTHLGFFRGRTSLWRFSKGNFIIKLWT